MAKRARADLLNSFFDQLKQALDSVQDELWLGQNSPLAAPYFLGAVLHGVDPGPDRRGLALRQVLEETLASMWGGPLPATGQEMLAAVLEDDAGREGTGRYDCLILELNYLQQRFRPPPRNQSQIYNDILHISRPTHDRHLRAAVEQLGARLLQRLRPALRAEIPIHPPALIQREEILARVLAELTQGAGVSLVGAGGVGKSALGGAVAAEWVSPAVFWYTFRFGLNDQLESLLFGLGHFLHTQGASSLWQQLIADRGQIQDSALALGLAIADLAGLANRPLLCFDEMDVLRPVDLDHPHPEHERLLSFLEGLDGHAPHLLMGQQQFWASDRVHRLDGLSPAGLGDLLRQRQVAFTGPELDRLHAYTQGNPRLVELCLALYLLDGTDSLSQALDALPRTPGLLPIWHRLQRRLPALQRNLLRALSVFRSPAPADAWQATGEQSATLQALVAQHLVQQDDRGGISLLPALQQVILDDMAVESRESLHAQAARIRAERGEFTAAAYHLWQADRPQEALALWYPRRSQEINRGQAGAALAVFAQLSRHRLPNRQQKELALLRSELYALRGEPRQAGEELEQLSWPQDDPASPEAALRLGQAWEAQGQPDRALDAFGKGLDAVNHLMRLSTELHVQRSLTHLRQKEVGAARLEANLARFHAEAMLGLVQDQQGDYGEAARHYQQALQIAGELAYGPGMAQIHHYLAILASRRQQLVEALPHFDQAIAFYEGIGDQANLEAVRSNLASAYIQAKEFRLALEPARRSLRFFERMGNTYRVALCASNLAEALAELDEFDEAQEYAQQVLDLEEPYSHPYALFTLGRIATRQQDWYRAEAYLDRCRVLAAGNDDHYLAAYAWRSLGELYRAAGRPADVSPCLNEALSLFERLQMTAEADQTRVLLAESDAN